MSNVITCPACAASVRPTQDVRGKKLACPKCGQPMVVTSAGIARRGEGSPVAAPPSGRGLPWGWMAAALLLSVAVLVALLATRRPKPEAEDQPVALKNAEGEAETAGASDKLRPFVPGKATPEPTPAPKPEPSSRPEPTPKPTPLPSKPEPPPVVAPPPMPKPKPEPRPLPPSTADPQPPLPVVPGIPAAGITYRFRDTLAAEEKGVPDLIATNPLSKNGFETATVFGHTQRVYRFSGNAVPPNQQAGLTFDNSRGLLTKDNYTIELVFVFDQNDNQWRRIVDVEDRQTDNGFYADPANHLQIYPYPGFGNTVTAGIYRHVVLAVSKTGKVNAYMDGGLQFSATTTIMSINNARNVVHFFLDNNAGPAQNEFSNGKIALLRLYNEVLSDDQVARLAAAFRGTTAPAPARIAEKDAAPDPGNLTAYQDKIGKTFSFRVTGSATGSVWGTGIYTADSTLAAAAVHAGALKPGETNVVRVRMMAGRSRYAGSTRNGVTTGAWTSYPASYAVSRASPGRKPAR